MSQISETLSHPRPKRPALVWVITIFYFFSAGFTILSAVLIYLGVIPVTPAAQHYFSSLTVVDHIITILIVCCNLIATVLLFLFRKQSFYFYSTAFVVSLLTTFAHAMTKGWLQAVAGAGFMGYVIGIGIPIAVITYSYRLMKKGVLR